VRSTNGDEREDGGAGGKGVTMLSRRVLIGKAAVGAVAAWAASGARTATAVASVRALPITKDDRREDAAADRDATAAVPSPAASTPMGSPAPWELLSPLGTGSRLGHGWRLADLGPVEAGACVVTLRNARGRAHRIHLCRNDGAPQGIIYTRRVDLVVMNEGYGDLPTEEGLAQAVAALAHVVAGNEATVPDGLLPHAERVRRFAAAGPPSAGKLR